MDLADLLRFVADRPGVLLAAGCTALLVSQRLAGPTRGVKLGTLLVIVGSVGGAAATLGSWGVRGQQRTSFMRFLRHHSDPWWVEIQAPSSPRSVARSIESEGNDGLEVATVDRPSDAEVVGGGGLPRRRSRASCCASPPPGCTEGRMSRPLRPRASRAPCGRWWRATRAAPARPAGRATKPPGR